MTSITIISWTRDLQTISLMQLVRKINCISLHKAKEAVEMLVDGTPITLTNIEPFDVDRLKQELEAIGAIIDEPTA